MRSIVEVAKRAPVGMRARERGSTVHGSWLILALFCLFTAGIGVQQARAETELLVSGCIAACATAWTNFNSGLTCAACLVVGGRKLSEKWLGKQPLAGYDCAKASINC